MSAADRLDVPGFTLDREYPAVPMASGHGGPSPGEGETFVVRGAVVDEEALQALRRRPEVVDARFDTVVEHFGPSDTLPGPQ
jgi:hypothetical protein